MGRREAAYWRGSGGPGVGGKNSRSYQQDLASLVFTFDGLGSVGRRSVDNHEGLGLLGVVHHRDELTRLKGRDAAGSALAEMVVGGGIKVLGTGGNGGPPHPPETRTLNGPNAPVTLHDTLVSLEQTSTSSSKAQCSLYSDTRELSRNSWYRSCGAAFSRAVTLMHACFSAAASSASPLALCTCVPGGTVFLYTVIGLCPDVSSDTKVHPSPSTSLSMASRFALFSACS